MVCLSGRAELQDRITGAAAGALAVGVTRLHQRETANATTETLGAYELVLRGRAASRRVDRAHNLEARTLFEDARDRDPEYPDAYAGLAWTHVADVWWGWSEWPHRSIQQALRAADRALELDPRNVRALTVRAEGLFLSGQKQAAEAECDRALSVNPNDATGLAMCGSVQVFGGAPEAGIPLLELSVRIDPDLPVWALNNLALGYYTRGEYERGADLLGRGGRGFDEDPAPHATLAALNARLGRTAAARREVDNALRLYPFFDPEIYANNVGNPGKSGELLVDLQAAGFR